MINGYDSIWKQRTRESNNNLNEGLIIAFRRKHFLLIKTFEVNLNQSYEFHTDYINFKKLLCTDDVGLIIFLQPIKKLRILQ